MSIFDNINNIIQHKKDEIPDAETFNHFMLQRWLSFHSPEYAMIINKSSNILWNVIDTKEKWNSLFIGVTPKSNSRGIKYIKKSAKEIKKEKNKDTIKILSEVCELSEKEISNLMEDSGIDIKKLHLKG